MATTVRITAGLVRIASPPGDAVTVWFQRDGTWSELWGDLGACALDASAALDAPVFYHAGRQVVRADGGRLVLVPLRDLSKAANVTAEPVAAPDPAA